MALSMSHTDAGELMYQAGGSSREGGPGLAGPYMGDSGLPLGFGVEREKMLRRLSDFPGSLIGGGSPIRRREKEKEVENQSRPGLVCRSGRTSPEVFSHTEPQLSFRTSYVAPGCPGSQPQSQGLLPRDPKVSKILPNPCPSLPRAQLEVKGESLLQGLCAPGPCLPSSLPYWAESQRNDWTQEELLGCFPMLLAPTELELHVSGTVSPRTKQNLRPNVHLSLRCKASLLIGTAIGRPKERGCPWQSRRGTALHVGPVFIPRLEPMKSSEANAFGF